MTNSSSSFSIALKPQPAKLDLNKKSFPKQKTTWLADRLALVSW